MFDKATLQDLPAYEALTDAGKAYVLDAFDSPPARAVGETALRNVAGAYASRKFRYLTEYESAGCEKVYVLNAIIDGDVAEVLSQPPPITVVSLDKRGRRRRREYVPDYLEVREGAITLIEAKTRDDLERLAETYDDWQLGENGSWAFLPALEECARLGLGFRIFCPDDLPQAFRANLQILARLPSEDLLAGNARTLPRIKRLLDRRPHTLAELSATSDRITGAFIYQALMRGDIWGNLRDQHFDLDFVLYGSQAEAYSARQSLAGKTREDYRQLHGRLLTCSATELEAARAAQARYDDRRKQGLKLNSTDYRDQRRLRRAEEEGAPRLAAFVRRLGDRGGRKKLLPENIHRAMRDHAESYLKRGGLPVMTRMYADFAQQGGLPRAHIPSRETYRKAVHEHLGPERAAFLSGGKRAFHAAKARTDGAHINAQLAIAGLRIHIDGVYGDVRSAQDESQVFQRPIFYLMVDDATGYVLGRGVRLGRSSSFASLMALRDCYLRHEHLPAQVHTDRGSEFKNHAFQDACAYFGVGFELRPSGSPRSGGMSEMLNQQLSAFLHNLAGGMYFDKAGRSADGTKKSRRTASLTVEEIIAKVDKWLFDVWNKSPFGSNKKSPEQAWLESLKAFPEALVPVEDTEMARYQTSYPLKEAKFDPVRGYRYGGQGYSSDDLTLILRRSERPTNPRLDCSNPSVIRVLTKQGALALRSTQYQLCQGLSEAQLLGRMSDLLVSRSREVTNQHRRLIKESQLLKEVAKTAVANQEKVADLGTIKDSQERVAGAIDFSDVMDGLPGGLAQIAALSDMLGSGDDRA